MNKQEAEQVVKKLLEDAKLHYQYQALRAEQELAVVAKNAKAWLESGAYRRRDADIVRMTSRWRFSVITGRRSNKMWQRCPRPPISSFPIGMNTLARPVQTPAGKPWSFRIWEFLLGDTRNAPMAFVLAGSIWFTALPQPSEQVKDQPTSTIYVVAYDVSLRRPGCVLLQAAMGGTYKSAALFSKLFDPDQLSLAPTEEMKAYRTTETQLEMVAEMTKKQRAD